MTIGCSSWTPYSTYTGPVASWRRESRSRRTSYISTPTPDGSRRSKLAVRRRAANTARPKPAGWARADCERLWRAFHDGGVTCLGSDHGTGGRTRATKQGGGGKHDNIWAARSGNRGGLEHFLPVMLTFGVNAGRISIEDLARIGSTNTAQVFGLYPRKGALIPRADADIVLVDPAREVRVDDRFYHCLCEVSVYQGWTFKGMATTTIVRGRVMMENGETVGKPGWGRYVPRGPAAAGGPA